jgi:hypothetical protein
MGITKALVLLVGALGVVAYPQAPHTKGQASRGRPCQAAKVFTPILPSLSGTDVPLRLPSSISFGDDANPLFSHLYWIDKSAYDIELTFDPDCNGVRACHFGDVRGVKGHQQPAPKGSSKVLLRHGIVANFTPSECGGTGSLMVLFRGARESSAIQWI